jgi:hypothetical protein
MINSPSQPAVRGRLPIPVTNTHPIVSEVRRRAIKALVITGGALAALLGLGWVGLQIQPAPFAAMPPPAAPPETSSIPAGLPAPVERYYRVTYSERVPVITSGVISGRGKMAPFGVSLPARFRFIHEAGRNFRAYFELTVFGLPVIKANEHYVDGKFRQELPFGVEEGEPKNDHSAAVRMWAEWVFWLPAMLLHDPEVRWEPIDDTMALLLVPVGTAQERLVVRFDPATGKVQYVEGMKYRTPADTTRTLWINAVWFGDKPWATLKVEDMAFNVPVDTSLATKGP